MEQQTLLFTDAVNPDIDKQRQDDTQWFRGYLFEKSDKRSLAARIDEACRRYFDRTGIAANVAQISDSETDALPAATFMGESVQIRRVPHIQGKNIFVGRA